MSEVQERIQRGEFKKRLAFVTISSVLLGISMPGMISSIFVWFGLVPLLFSLKDLKWWKALLWGWYFGSLYIGLALYWLLPTLTKNISEFIGFPSFLGVFAFFLMVVIEGSFFAILGLSYNLIERIRSPKIPVFFHAMSFAGLYTLMEYFRGFGELGFTGARLSDALYSQIGLIQIATISGTLGITFLIVFMNYMIYSTLKNRVHWYTLISLLLVIIVFYSLSFIVPQPLKVGKNQMRIGVVQTDVSVSQQYRLRTSEIVQRVDNDLAKLSKNSSLIVFPEGTFLYDFTKSSVYPNFVSTLRADDVHVILGYPSTFKGHFYNSAGLFGASGLEQIYSKHILVPFTETLPYPQIFGVFGFLKLTNFFSPGKKFTIFKWNGTKFAVQICFESYFGRLSRKFTNEGAQFLITITDDSWFDQRTALVQHFAQTVFRAIENRKWAIQVAATGITGVVDPYGHIVKVLPVDSKVESSFFVVPNKIRTFYDRFGDWIIWFSIGIVVLNLVVGIVDGLVNKKERNV